MHQSKTPIAAWVDMVARRLIVTIGIECKCLEWQTIKQKGERYRTFFHREAVSDKSKVPLICADPHTLNLHNSLAPGVTEASL